MVFPSKYGPACLPTYPPCIRMYTSTPRCQATHWNTSYSRYLSVSIRQWIWITSCWSGAILENFSTSSTSSAERPSSSQWKAPLTLKWKCRHSTLFSSITGYNEKIVILATSGGASEVNFVVILTRFSSLPALSVVISKTFRVATDENCVKWRHSYFSAADGIFWAGPKVGWA